MSNNLTPPHLLFTDIDGSPLDAGFVFIGEDQKDPIQFPIEVFWDEALTEPVTQPIRTRNGYISRDGEKAFIYTAANKFSVGVKDRNEDPVYQKLSFEQFIKENAVQALIDAALTPVNESINEEVDRATEAEAVLNNSILAEKNRAIAAESVLDGKINANGVGNRAYKTYAEMDADKANIPPKSKVTVTNDPTVANNGDWQWDGVVFTKSTYDPLSSSKDYTDKKVSEFLIKTPSKLLQAFSDVNGDVYAYFDENGHLMVTDLDSSVQAEIIEIKQKTDSILTKDDSDLYQLIDKDGNLVSKVDKDGDLYLTGIDSSVQDYLININTNTGTLSAPKTFKTLADLYSPETLNCLNSNDVKAPIGRGLLPQQYYLGKEWIKHLSAPVSPERIIIGAYNDKGTATNWVPDSGVVHPNLIKFDQPLCGYKYWMGINPYTNTNEDYELPYIYGSNSDNLDNWTLIPDFPQPFDVDPPDTGGVLSGHLSDSCFTYDTVNAELWFFWRQTRYYSADRNRANATNTFVGRKTKDGTNWSDIITIYPTYTINNDLKLSPAIIHNPKDGLFYLYYINLNGSMSCEVTENLSHPSWRKIADIQVPFTAWHLEIKWVGSALVALIHSDTVDQLFVGTSTDMKNWEWSAGVFNAATNLYKSSFLPVFNDNNQVSLKIVYTTDQNSTPKWQLHTTQTNFTNIEA